MYIIYILNKEKKILNQVFEISHINIKIQLNNISTASFVLENKKINKTIFRENNRISIKKMDSNWIEKELFYWIIAWMKSDLSFSEILCKSELYLLKKKIIFSDKNYINKTPAEIINDIIIEVNNRDTWFIKQNFINANENLPDRKYKKWKTFFDILKHLAWDIYDFDFKDGNIYFQKDIWKDRSSWKDIVFFEYNIFSPESSNILKAEKENNIDNIANSIITDNWNLLDNDSIALYWILEQNFSKEEASKVLAEHKNSLDEYKIIPKWNNFFLCNVWDFVKVFIDSWSEVLKFNWSLKVLEKTYKSGDISTVSFKLNNWKRKTLDLIETITKLKWDIEDLKK